MLAYAKLFSSLLLAISCFAGLSLCQFGNLTLRLFTVTSDGCDIEDSSQGVTFTTSSVPLGSYCFNVETLFTPYGTHADSDPVMLPSLSGQTIDWQISNQNVYSEGQNYSILQYEQQSLISPGTSQHTVRILETFGAHDCFQGTTPDGYAVFPILRWTCQSSSSGDCYTAPYNIMSFRISPAGPVDSHTDKCWVASTSLADISAHRSITLAQIALIIATVITSWLFNP